MRDLLTPPAEGRQLDAKIPTRVFHDSTEAASFVARMIAEMVEVKRAAGRCLVLGLPTGSTPISVYRELIRLHDQGRGLDLGNVVTFNLDEYYPIRPDSLQSYHRWMRENFFDHVNIPEDQIHIPDGTVRPDCVEESCRQYEAEIARAGGIELQLLGIGRTGHIGFNEPGSTRDSHTRLVTLDPVTRKDAASDFFGEANVPQQAITMGVGTILEARTIVIMALGEHKAGIVRAAVEGAVSEEIAASFLQEHPDSQFVLDEAAAGELTAIKTPWKVGPVTWTPARVKRAVVWLSRQAGKTLSMLDEGDFRAHDLYSLLRECGPAEALAAQVFRQLMETICTQPGGRTRQTVLCFSPHPDDDVISMGGTLIRLVEQGHQVHVAYMTSGNIAVFDHDVIRFLDFVAEYHDLFKIKNAETTAIEARVARDLARKKPGEVDTREVLGIKGLIRKTEAVAAARSVGIPEKHLHFLNLPFYQTGRVAKDLIGPRDVRIVRKLLEKLRPGQIYVAGDLSDPHGTHRLCAEAIFAAVREIRRHPAEGDGQGAGDLANMEVWLYRGAWQEWQPHEIERAVPLSPNDLERKKFAIFKHESQKDAALFPGPYDTREFWQRASDRNRHTAQVYDQLGLPQYYALEGFVQWKDE